MFNKLWLKYEKSIIKDEKDEKNVHLSFGSVDV